MANSNRVLVNAKRAMTLVVEEQFNSRNQAEDYKDELTASGEYKSVRLTSFKYGNRKSPSYSYTVRAYQS